ncbi:MAG: hypothetical protein R6W96_04580 [Clostridia bacterium]
MMFFDCNVRLGRANHPDNSRIHTVVQLISHMDEHGIEKALVYHKHALISPEEGNKLLLDEIKGHVRLTGCGVMVPLNEADYKDPEHYLEIQVRNGIRAVRFFPGINAFSLKPYSMSKTLQQIETFRLPVFIDCINPDNPMLPYSSWGYSPDYDGIHELASAFPGIPFIVLLPGMISQRFQYAVLKACPNVMLECSSFGYRNIDFFCSIFGAERLIFGSCTPQLDTGAFLSCLQYAGISSAEKELIAGGTLERLLQGVRIP